MSPGPMMDNYSSFADNINTGNSFTNSVMAKAQDSAGFTELYQINLQVLLII